MARAGNGDGSIRKRETKTKGTVWDVQLTIRDRRGVAHRLTKRGFATRKEAADWRNTEQRKVKVSNARGVKPLSVPELIEKFIQEGPLKGSTPQSYGKVLQLYIKPLLNVKASSLSAPALQRFADRVRLDLEGRGYDGAVTVGLAVTAVRGALRWASSDSVGLLDHNPIGTATIALPQRRASERRPFTEEELQRLFSSSAGHSLLAWRIIFESAIRDGEALALRWRALDLSTGRLDINRIRTPESNYSKEQARTKGGKDRTAYLSAPLCDDLRTLREERGAKGTDYIIVPLRGTGGISMSTLQKWWDTDRKAAGLTGRVIHELRHTWATMALRGGVDVRVVQEVLGHSSLGTTMRYLHATEDGKRDASNVVQSIISPPVDAAKTASLNDRTIDIA